MNLLGITQGSSFRIFLRLTQLLDSSLPLNDVSAFVADSRAFKALGTEEARIASRINLLKEWEITKDGRARTPDWSAISKWEESLGDPVFWNVLMADRRLYFGPRCKMKQDYAPRFSHAQMGGILQTALERIDAFIRSAQPDVVLGFGIATFGDYLFYRFAKERGIPYLQLKATKIGNYVSLNDDAIALSRHIWQMYRQERIADPVAADEARSYIETTRSRGLQYEGVLRPRTKLHPLRGLGRIARGVSADAKSWLDPDSRNDSHLESLALSHLYGGFLNPAKAAWLRRRLKKRLLRQEQLVALGPFAFYPLHFEPEVAMQVFGRPFQNQIELIRTLAMSLPAGMLLVVKEHPRAAGFRPWSYYRKLLQIPNVRLVDDRISTHSVIQAAQLVAVISGSTGLEAAICGKPVVVFGIPPFSILPGNMVYQVKNMHDLAFGIQNLLSSYRYEPEHLERYVASVISGSVPIDLYTALLAKPDRVSADGGLEDMQSRQAEGYSQLAAYCRDRLLEELSKLRSLAKSKHAAN